MLALMLALRQLMACSIEFRTGYKEEASSHGYHQLGRLLLYEMEHHHILGNAFLDRSDVRLYCSGIPQIFHESYPSFEEHGV